VALPVGPSGQGRATARTRPIAGNDPNGAGGAGGSAREGETTYTTLKCYCKHTVCVQVSNEEGRAMSTISTATAAVAGVAAKKVSILCAWLTALLIGAGCFYVGMAAFAGRVGPALHVYSYPEGRCTIHFIRPIAPWRHHPLGGAAPRYIIVFSFTVHTESNQEYQIVGAGVGNTMVSSNEDAQNVVNSYHQGGVYPCWYNPADPSHVVLYRSFPVLPFAWCSAFAAVGLLVMLKALTRLASSSLPMVGLVTRRRRKRGIGKKLYVIKRGILS
jgi:hypothetical protein